MKNQSQNINNNKICEFVFIYIIKARMLKIMIDVRNHSLPPSHSIIPPTITGICRIRIRVQVRWQNIGPVDVVRIRIAVPQIIKFGIE